MKKRGVKLVRCLFADCPRPCPEKRVVCVAHWCDCCADTSAEDGRYVSIWGRVHFVSTKHLSSADMKQLKHLHLDYRNKSLCPISIELTRCQARAQGRPVSQNCSKIFLSGFFDKEKICPECHTANRCAAYRMDTRNTLVRCWNVHDLENPHRNALGICNDDLCNVRVKCYRHTQGCKGGGYNDNITKRDLTVPQLCKDCVTKYCLCSGCGRMGQFRKSILFSKYVYRTADGASFRNRCIYCIQYNGSRASAMLQWWVLRPTVDKWIKGIHALGILSEEQAKFVVLNWNDSTPPQRALYMHKKRGKSNVKHVMRRFGSSDSTTELFYRTAALPTDLFMIILRMAAK